MPELRPGIYRHYKGSLYLVLGLASDANAEDLDAFITKKVDDTETSGGNALYLKEVWGHAGLSDRGERTVVVYVPLQLDGAHPGPRMKVRTLEDFLALVEITEGVGAEGGWKVPRFNYLGSELTSEMLEQS